MKNRSKRMKEIMPPEQHGDLLVVAMSCVEIISTKKEKLMIIPRSKSKSFLCDSDKMEELINKGKVL